MADIISTVAEEKGTISFYVAFTDEDGQGVTPNSITYTLTDADGTVINSLEDESVTPDEGVYITLSGDDLALQTGETARLVARHLLVEAVVDTNRGSNLPIKREAHFVIENLTAVT